MVRVDKCSRTPISLLERPAPASVATSNSRLVSPAGTHEPVEKRGPRALAMLEMVERHPGGRGAAARARWRCS